jgi:hypothetical protein
MRIVVHHGRQSKLANIARTLNPSGGTPRCLYCRQEQASQDRDNRDHHQKFDQRKTPSSYHPAFLRKAGTGFRSDVR